MRIAVTGANGFIGSALTNRLKDDGHEVIEISRIEGLNLLNWGDVKDIDPCEVLIHLAAKTFVPDSFENPREFYSVNHELTLNALELARQWKARVIYMSSYFYGPPQYIPVDEKHSIHPHNPYAQSKMISEELCQGYSRDFDLSVISFRLFNLYGPGQSGSLLIPEILDKIEIGSQITLKDPRPKRDYIHIYDVVDAIRSGLNFDENGFHVFNLGSGKSYSVQELVEAIQNNSPKKFSVTFTNEYRKGEVLDSMSDNSKIQTALNWQAKISLEEGIKTLFESK